jgi:hypothetical protein
VARRGRYAKRRVEAQPADLRNEDLGPGVRRLSADHVVRARRGLRRFWWRQVAGDVARRQATPARQRDQRVGEVLARARPAREHVAHRRVHVRRALLVAEVVVHDPDGREREADGRSAARVLDTAQKRRARPRASCTS